MCLLSCGVVALNMDGVLNETTNKIHRHETGCSDFRTTCGATIHVAHDNLRLIAIERAVTDADVTKCGRCFADGSGY
ncbi:hypothetical protein BDK88_2592 [Natrinema hispanicum]|uniref:Uncharacterized protein n=2 Tax=Natrinema hispanicum TaxID=392421 RepID=A0A482Y5E4_9EURY|nr:hypothetical protein BDK88_2592 [Natrinema hispanicum]